MLLGDFSFRGEQNAGCKRGRGQETVLAAVPTQDYVVQILRMGCGRLFGGSREWRWTGRTVDEESSDQSRMSYSLILY